MAKIVVDTYQNVSQIAQPVPVVDVKAQALPIASANQSTAQPPVIAAPVVEVKALPVVEKTP
jgi:hypothetical protein